MVGKYGDVIFETSDKRILAFNDFSQTVSGKWSSHEVIGKKERSEFNGPGKRQISFKMTLSAEHGVRPRKMLAKLEKMAEQGKVDYMVIGGRPVGDNRFFIASMSEKYGAVLSGGELMRAEVNVTMQEYV